MEEPWEGDARFCAPDDYTYRMDPVFVQQCSEMIKAHMEPMIKELDELDARMRERKKQHKRE